MRIDLWLKLVCLFKHRSEATDACKGGLVKINGSRVKPSADVKLNDVVEIVSPRYRKVVAIGIPLHNVSKEVARTEMFRDETPPPSKELTPTPAHRDRGLGRPTKKDRRDVDKWRHS